MVGVVEVRDYVLWPKHIHGDLALRKELLALEAGAVIALMVDGTAGTWVKMDDSRTGAPTPGLKALGAARDHWHGLFRSRRGAVITISKASPEPGVQQGRSR